MVEPSTQKTFTDLTDRRFDSYLQLVLKKAGSYICINKSQYKWLGDDREIIVRRIEKTFDILGIKYSNSTKYRIKVEK